MKTAVGVIRALCDNDSDSVTMLVSEAVKAEENVGLGAVLICVFLIDVLSREMGLTTDEILEQLGLYVSTLDL